MSLRSLDSDALHQLQSEQSQLLDAIDELRSLHLGQLVELPQLIVCGDQSSGKSSVLEAISRVRFPAKGGVCTRFATEVILRKKPDSDIRVTIEPGPSRVDAEERRRLRGFKFSNTSSPDTSLPALIESAKEWMGISTEDERTAGFSDDVLKVEISGPDKPGLTLVDLPGLYHAKSKEQGAQGIPIVRNLVKSYMKNKRSLILAVISAKNEYNNQEVLDLAEKYDKKRERTLAIVTKPDTLPENSEEEQMYIQLVKNERINLQLGWHALRNRDYETRDTSDSDRDELERRFFSDGRWASIRRELVGIDTLRPRLSSILLDHISRSLPSLINDIECNINDRRTKLDQLGEERATVGQKRSFLLNVSSRFEKITSQAINGMYLDGFFGGLFSTSTISALKRLRAITRDLNGKFALDIMNKGRRRRIVYEDSALLESPTESETESEVSVEVWDGSATITVAELEDEIREMARKNRGIELPGTSNHFLVGELFRDQSKPWERIAETYLTNVWQAIKSFTELLMLHLTDKTTYRLLMSSILNPALETMKECAQQKLEELISHHKKGHPLPFDEEFLKTMKSQREKRQLAVMERRLLERYPEAADHKHKAMFSFRDIQNAVTELNEVQGDQFAAREIIDLMEVYYDMAQTTFIDNMTILVAENCLIAPLGTIFTALTVSNMDEADIERLAAEPIYVLQNRQQFRSELQRLHAALKVCKHHVTGDGVFLDTQSNAAPTLPLIVTDRDNKLNSGPTLSSSTRDSQALPARTRNNGATPAPSTTASDGPGISARGFGVVDTGFPTSSAEPSPQPGVTLATSSGTNAAPTKSLFGTFGQGPFTNSDFSSAPDFSSKPEAGRSSSSRSKKSPESPSTFARVKLPPGTKGFGSG